MVTEIREVRDCNNPPEDAIATWLPTRRVDYRLAYGPDAAQFGDLWIPRDTTPGPNGYPVAIVVHGGLWTSEWTHEHCDRMAEALSDAGFATWNLEFRKLGNTGGGFPGTFEDIATAVDHVRELAKDFPLDLSKVVVVGHSSGAHLAAWIGARHNLPADSPLYRADPLPISGVVELAPVTDLQLLYDILREDWPVIQESLYTLSGADSDEGFAAMLPQISPAHMGPAGVPRTMVIGEDDPTPVDIVRGLAQQAEEAGDTVTLVVFASANHFDLGDPGTELWDSIVDRVKEHVRD
ncbi:alpha/beta hydrolase [Microbacterium sp. X-17]|uniref:alpha/beta hydrolase n=1 Tax=Microbacterium sp. X-17 TaxID=3144404 RepID=UPI0031F5CC72